MSDLVHVFSSQIIGTRASAFRLLPMIKGAPCRYLFVLTSPMFWVITCLRNIEVTKYSTLFVERTSMDWPIGIDVF